jgi:hypothetical protein
MNIFPYTNREIEDAKQALDDFDIHWYENQPLNFSNMPWEEYKEGKLGPDKKWVRNKLKEVHNLHGDFLDIVAFVVPDKDWENGEHGIWGWHLANPMRGYEVIIVKDREDYQDTFEHEAYHCWDDLVWTYCRYSLETIFNVPDFDEFLVHAKDPRFEEYEWEQVAPRIAKHVNRAIAIKRGRIDVSQMRKMMIQIRKTLLRMKSQVKEVEEGGMTPGGVRVKKRKKKS